MTTEQMTLEFNEGFCRFSAGHFTIFSRTHREHLHGHNYSLAASVTAAIQEPGLTFDYAIFKNKVKSTCEPLDRRFLLPANCPYLTFEESGDYCTAIFNQEKIPFLKKNILLLPIKNTTLEELSQWFLNQIISDKPWMKTYAIVTMTLKVFNGPEQNAVAQWHLTDNFLDGTQT